MLNSLPRLDNAQIIIYLPLIAELITQTKEMQLMKSVCISWGIRHGVTWEDTSEREKWRISVTSVKWGGI